MTNLLSCRPPLGRILFFSAAIPGLVASGLATALVPGATALADKPQPSIDKPLPTPAMGWSTFNYFIAQHNDPLFRQTALAYERSGLRNAGYTLLRIDGGWWGDDGNHRHYYWTTSGRYEGGLPYKPGDPHVEPRNYPHGIKPLADFLHQRGMKLGFYVDPPIAMGEAANFPGNGEQQVPPPVTGVDLVKQFAQFAADNDIDHQFLDGYNWPTERGDVPFRTMYEELRRHAQEQNRPIIYSINGRHDGHFDRAHPDRLADEWRTGPDIDHPWRKILGCLGTMSGATDSGHGRWANPDYLMVGFIDDYEAKTQMSLWCTAGAPLYLSHDFRVINDWDRYVILNTEAIAVDQDPAANPGKRLRQTDTQQVWMRPLADGSTAVVLANTGDKSQTLSIRWTDLGLPAGPVQVRDLWQHRNLGTVQDGYTATDLPGRDCVLLKVMPGTQAIAEPQANWAPHPGKRTSYKPLKNQNWQIQSSMTRDAHKLSSLFDANSQTRFESTGRPGDYVQVSFGQATRVDRIVIDTPGDGPAAGPNPWPYKVYAQRQTYAIEASPDGENFQPVADGTFGSRYTISTFKPVEASSVRIVLKSPRVDPSTEWTACDIYLFNTGSSQQ